ncbi:putative ribonuclease H-like domain-containing protein [Tanacetum coccineum]
MLVPITMNQQAVAKALSDHPGGSNQEELLHVKLQHVWILVDLPNGKKAIGTKWVFKNKKDERGIMIRNKASNTIVFGLLLLYGFLVIKWIKECFLYGTIEEEVYVTQPLRFEDPDYPDKVYKVVKALYGLHQALRAWFEYLGMYKSKLWLQLLQLKLNMWLLQVVVDKYSGFKPNCWITGIKTHLGISKEVGTPRYLSLVVPLTKVGDEAVHKELGDRMERAATNYSRFRSRAGQWLKLVLSVFVSAVKCMLMLPVQVSAVEVNPVIYTSCIEQFWATAKVQTVNGVRQLQALVDKKRVIVTESSIRRDLHLDDAEGTDCLPTATIFEELARVRGKKSRIKKLTL